jgi:hypothetical protein
MNPTIAGFTSFIYSVMGINSSVLPATSPYIATSYQYALDIVSEYLGIISPDAYTSAVYNLAGHNLMVWAQDQPVLISVVQAYIAGTTLNVTAFNTGSTVALNALVSDGVTLNNAVILNQLGGPALGIGAYQLDGYYNIPLEAMTVATPIIYQNNLPYFAYWRAQWGINKFTAGVVESTSDDGTSVSFHVPAFMDDLPMSALSYLKTPFGRAYLDYAQRIGGAFGMS